jgi:leader peptidase (prepilin peptidase)/N-methyltransferase
MLDFLRLHRLNLPANYAVSSNELLACVIAGVLVFCMLLTREPVTTSAAGGLLLSSMLVIALTDSREFAVPDVLSVPAIAAGLGFAPWTSPGNAQWVLFDHFLAAVAAGGGLFVIRELYRRLRSIEGLGLGDVKLAAATGAWVGLAALPLTFLLATGAALAAVLIASLRQRNVTMMTAVPFGSFIAAATAAVWFFDRFGLVSWWNIGKGVGT